jgi:hypothetical protein
MMMTGYQILEMMMTIGMIGVEKKKQTIMVINYQKEVIKLNKELLNSNYG